MTTRDAIKHYGGVSALARALGIDRRSVWKWGDRPPTGRQYELEVLTAGTLRADREPSTDVKAEAS